MGAAVDRRSLATVGVGWLAALGVGSAALLLWIGVKPTLAGINSDAAVYLLQADWLSPWRATDIDFGARLFAHYPFPPLYPLLMALLGIGSGTPELAYALDALLLATAVVASACWARRIGCGVAGVMLAACSLALTPIALFTAMGVFSEPLYLALSMAALAIVARPRPAPRHWYAAAMLLGAAALTRGAGLFALAALLGCWAWRTRGRDAGLTPLLAIGAPLAWMLFKAAQGWSGGYTHTLFAGGVAPVLAGLVEQLPTNLRALAYHFPRCFDFLGSRHGAVIVAVLFVPAVLSWARRLREAQVDAWYALIYLGVIVAWPYPNHFARFLLVLLPLYAAYAALGMTALAGALGHAAATRHAASLCALLLALVVAPSALQIAFGIARAADAEESVHARMASWYGHDSLATARRATAFSLRVLEVMGDLGAQLPKDACVSATMAEMFMLHARRYSRPPPSQRDSLASLRDALARCPYVLMLGATAFPAADFPAYYPRSRVADDLDTLVSVQRTGAQRDGAPLAILARFDASRRHTEGDPARRP